MRALKRGISSVGRASACHAEGREFEPHIPLHFPLLFSPYFPFHFFNLFYVPLMAEYFTQIFTENAELIARYFYSFKRQLNYNKTFPWS